MKEEGHPTALPSVTAVRHQHTRLKATQAAPESFFRLFLVFSFQEALLLHYLNDF